MATQAIEDGLRDQVRDAAQSLFHDQVGRAADTVHGVAEAFRQAAGQFARDDRVAVARYADQAARQFDRLSAALRDPDFGEIVARTEAFARQQPSVFVAGAVAAGFIVGRLLVKQHDRDIDSRMRGTFDEVASPGV